MNVDEYILNNKALFKDKFDNWLFNEFGLLPGCSSMKSFEYSVAREVLDRFSDIFFDISKEAFCLTICKGHPPRFTCCSLGTCIAYDIYINKLNKLLNQSFLKK